jgi:hypothetical protein
MGDRQIVLVSTAGFSVLNTGIFWRDAKTKRLFSQCMLPLDVCNFYSSLNWPKRICFTAVCAAPLEVSCSSAACAASPSISTMSVLRCLCCKKELQSASACLEKACAAHCTCMCAFELHLEGVFQRELMLFSKSFCGLLFTPLLGSPPALPPPFSSSGPRSDWT